MVKKIIERNIKAAAHNIVYDGTSSQETVGTQSDDPTRGSYCIAPRPEFAGDAPFDLCFTPAAIQALLSSVGRQVPEAGAKGFGPVDRFGFDVVEFDVEGSRRAGGAIYSPDVVWGEQQCRHWLDQSGDEMRVWTGDLHSHPGRFGHPSGKSGPGMGDLGYVEEVFAQNEAMQYFAIPIVTLNSPTAVTDQTPEIPRFDPPSADAWIWPWIVSRSAPHRPLWANLRVCPVSEFPDRVFNPAWEASLDVVQVDREPIAAPVASQKQKVSKKQYISEHRVASSDPVQDALTLGTTGLFLLGMAFLQLTCGQRGRQPDDPVVADPSHSRALLTSTSEALDSTSVMISPPMFPPWVYWERNDLATLPGNFCTILENTTMNSYNIIAQMNPNAFCDQENGRDVFIEDYPVDDRWYRIEYRCLPNGENASAWLLCNPWAEHQVRRGLDFTYSESHLRNDGLICIAADYDPDASPYNLEFAIRRARFWATGFSFLIEHSYEATCEAIPEWRS